MSNVKETLDAHYHDENGQRILNQYILTSELGTGAYGTVYLALDTLKNTRVAIKECSKSKLRKQKLASDFVSGRGRRGRGASISNRRVTITRPTVPIENSIDLVKTEVAILKKMSHEHIVKLYEVLDDPDQDSLFMVFELCEFGSCIHIEQGKHTNPLNMDLCRSYFQQLILAVEYLHECGIAHRDIKPDNILISANNVLKVVDFGVSELFTRGQPQLLLKNSKTAGSPAFFAPEMCGLTKSVQASAGDVWAMGVTLYAMSFGYLPFNGEGLMQLYDSIKDDKPVYPPGTDSKLTKVLDRLLEKNPDSRITLEELRHDEWVTDCGRKEMISFEENCKVQELIISEKDISSALKPAQSTLFTVLRAAQKFKRGLKKK